jgi:hypothetical protein
MRGAMSIFLLGAAIAMPLKGNLPPTGAMVEPHDGAVNGLASGEPPAQLTPADVPYLIGHGPCVAIEEGWAVDPGTRLLAIARGKEPAGVTIEELRPWQGRSFGGPRRPRTDCTSWFQEDVTGDSGDRAVPVKSLARVSISSDDWAFFALEPQPPRIIVAGAPRSVGPAERRRLIEAVRRSLPPSWTPTRALVSAQRFGPTRGHQVIELSVGWPARNAQGITPSIKHVAIRRFFLVDGHVAASEDFERTSGVEERVDTAAPELTDDNWSVLDTETTLAFVSSDDGTSWQRLSTNVGFETTIWLVQGLREGLPVLFLRELYTHH